MMIETVRRRILVRLEDGSRPCFDYEMIRIESGRLDHARAFFAHPIKSR
jgi:hypothetical protein